MTLLNRFFLALSRFMACAGGFVLVSVIFLICFSVVGRHLNSLFHIDKIQGLFPVLTRWVLEELEINEIPGSYELTESGMAFVVFAFFPLTHMTSGHAVVDLFTNWLFNNWLGTKIKRWFVVLIEIFMSLAITLIAVQLFQGMISKMNSGQTSLFLQYPVWWAYALCLNAAVISSLVSWFVVLARIQEAIGNLDLLVTESEEFLIEKTGKRPDSE